MQASLFEHIQSVSTSHDYILSNIMALYLDGKPFHYDATYNTGGFWNFLPGPEIRGDLNPRGPRITKIDIENTGFIDNTIRSITYDPPFLIGNGTTRMEKKYGSFSTAARLFHHYNKALQEISRILIPSGILVVKCQDVTHGSQLYLSSVNIINAARDYGLTCIDYFIRVNYNLSYKSTATKHSSKIHTFFLVFRKKSRKHRVSKF